MMRRTGTIGILVGSVLASSLALAPTAQAEPAGAAVINEIHYHPVVAGREFLELHNPGAGSFDLTGACFIAGISGCFDAGTAIPAGGFVVVAESPADYLIDHPSGPVPVLDYGGNLSNSGERVTLSIGGVVLDTVAYTDRSPWPASPDGSGPSLELIDPLSENDAYVAWAASDPAPTPGAVNTWFGRGPLPQIGEVMVGTVAAGQPIDLTAAVSGTTDVVVEVQVGFEAVQRLAMVDDGTGGDATGGDGVFTVTLAGRPANTLVRYRVVATTADGATATHPANGDTRPRLGFVVAATPSPTGVPLLRWWIDPADLATLLANAATNDYVPSAVSYGTQVWDGAQVRAQGSVRTVAKLSFKFKMPKGHDLVAPGLVEHPVDEFVLDSDRGDVLGLTPILAFAVYEEGNPFLPQRAKVRVERNGAYAGLYTFVEEWEDNWQARVGLVGPGYEIYEPKGVDGILIDEGSPGPLVPRFEKLYPGGSHASLYELVQAIDAPPTPARAERLRDLFDIPALVEFLAVGTIVQHWDSTVHNYVLVRDGASGRWRFIPHDLDNALGLPHGARLEGSRLRTVFPHGPDPLVSALRADPVVNELYLRRVRTLAERHLVGGEIAARAAALGPVVAQDVAEDLVRWPYRYPQEQGPSQLASFLAWRERTLLHELRGPGEVPGSQAPEAAVVITHVVHLAPEGASHDRIELSNPDRSSAVDVSGWLLRGAADAVLPEGTVVPAGGTVFVPGDPVAAASTWPSGTLVAGRLTAGVADGGGTVEVVDRDGAVRHTVVIGSTAPLPGPPAVPLRIEAAADQSELAPGDGSGAWFTVVVENVGAQPREGVILWGSGTTCPRLLGTMAPGARVRLRCSSLAGLPWDRTYLFSATSGTVRADSEFVRVRSLRHPMQYLERFMLDAPSGPSAVVGAEGAVGLRWTLPLSSVAPLRWMIVTGTRGGEAAPSIGRRFAPASAAEIAGLPLDQPVQLQVAARNQSGTGPRTAPTPPLTPRATAAFPFSSVDEAIARLYRDLDGRAPTSTELAIWRAHVQGGGALGAVVANRLAQPRWRQDVEPLARLYVAFFGRLPDREGLDYWVRRRRAGTTLDHAAASFAASSEFRRAYGSLSDRAFVEQVYRNVLGREADPAGRTYWVGRLAVGWSRGRVMTSFSESSEGRRRLNPRAQVAVVWAAMAKATPSPAVAQPGVDWLAGGGDLATLAESVRTSDRYATHVG
jgi:hypothetical protein